jgi:prepilin-type N-terminal cleavage/methylation domain-containing protein
MYHVCMTTRTYKRHAFTLLELLVTLSLIALLSAIAVPRAVALRDTIAVRGAANDAEALLSAARALAIARATRTSVDIDMPTNTLWLLVGADTIRYRRAGALHGVALWASRTQVTYAPTGAGLGGSNLTLILTKGSAADTLFVSRLGRVRR